MLKQQLKHNNTAASTIKVSLRRCLSTKTSWSGDLTSEERRAKLLIETDELGEMLSCDHRDKSRLRLINASWFPPGGALDARKLHEQRRLTESSQYFSISEVAD